MIPPPDMLFEIGISMVLCPSSSCSYKLNMLDSDEKLVETLF